MSVKTTIEEEIEYGVEVKVTYRASRNHISRKTRVKMERIDGFEEWKTASEVRVDASEIPESVRETLKTKSNDEAQEAVAHHREIRQTLRGAE